MKTRLSISILCLMTLITTSILAHIPDVNRQQSSKLAKIVQHVSPAVVSIKVLKKPDSNFESREKANEKPPEEIMASGSGVIFDAKHGYIVTNAHVVDHAKLIIVRLTNGQRYVGHLKGIDNGFDIAVLQIFAKKLTSLTFADSDLLKVGNFVVALGSPFGLDQTVTSGVVSALNVSAPKIEGFQSFIQTDASINPGNSGGPLINMQGKIVGINTAIIGPANIGIGFAIPSDMVVSVITQLLEHGKVERGMLGVVAQNMTQQLASALGFDQLSGTLVSKVLPGSPAAIAGVKLQDIIEKVNGKSIQTASQLRNMLGVMRPGTPLKLTLRRKHKTITISTKVGNPSTIIHEKVIPFLAGIKLHDFKELEPNGQTLTGAIVTEILPTSQAALAGIMPGDVITAAQNKQITDTASLVAIAKKATKPLLVKITRGNMSAYIVIEEPLRP